jgi:hypothetical protein
MKKFRVVINFRIYLLVAVFFLLGPLFKALPLILFGERTTAMSKTLNAHLQFVVGMQKVQFIIQ